MQDLRYALRLLRKSPGFAAAVVLSLALGIGANTAIFSLIDALMLRTLPIRDPDQLFYLTRTQGDEIGYGFTYGEYRRLRDRDDLFTGVAAYSPVRLNVAIDGSAEPTAEGHLVSGGYFPLLGVSASAGRTIGAADDIVPDGHPVAMISDGYWKRRFARDPRAIGRAIALSGRQFTVIGVTPAEFFGLEVGSAPDIFVPMMMQPTVMPATENWLGEPINSVTWLKVVTRLKSGVSRDQAAARLAAAAVLDPVIPKPGRPPIKERAGLGSAATGLSLLRGQFSRSLFVLMTVVVVVLLIACANVANLLLARGAARAPEFAMRLALGANRWRLTRQVLVESVLLAALGGAAGVLLAQWATRLLVVYMSSGRSPIVLDLDADLRVLVFTLAVSLLTGVLFGFAPALRAGRTGLAAELTGQAGRATSDRRRLGPRQILVVSQVALCVLLLSAAGLFVRSLQNLNSQDAGFPRETVLVVRVEPKGSDQRGLPGASARLDRIYRDLLQRVEAISGVRSASLAHHSPTTPVGLSSSLKLQSGEEMRAPIHQVYPKYFATMGLPLLSGRDFDGRDMGEGSPPVAVVNEAFARRAFGGEDPVGQSYNIGPRAYEIVGVVKNSTYANLRADTKPVAYQPFLQTNTGRGQMVLHVRTFPGSAGVSSRVREEVQRVDAGLPVFDVHTLAAEIDGVLIRERLIATFSSGFGLLALLLACLGVYGVMAFAVVRRTREMGIRMALGATRRDILAMVMREAVLLTATGVLVGLPAGLAASRLASSRLSGLLYGLGVTDPATLSQAVLVMAVGACVAAYIPARRASRADPLAALRHE